MEKSRDQDNTGSPGLSKTTWGKKTYSIEDTLTLNNRGGMIGDLVVKLSLTPQASNNTPPVTKNEMVFAEDPKY